MTAKKVSDTAVTIIRREAKLIEEYGWCHKIDDNLAARKGAFGLNLSLAACWAVYGEPCQPRDLDGRQSEIVAEILEIIEVGLRMTAIEYEAKFADAFPGHVASDLRLVAWNLEKEILSGGTTFKRPLSPYGYGT